jgi:hypothetical protein
MVNGIGESALKNLLCVYQNQLVVKMANPDPKFRPFSKKRGRSDQISVFAGVMARLVLPS